MNSIPTAKAPCLLESVTSAKRVKARVGGAVFLAARGVRHKLLGRASALLAVGACCAGLGFRCDLAAEATQCCCCFVLHGAANKTEPLGFVKRFLHSPHNYIAEKLGKTYADVAKDFKREGKLYLYGGKWIEGAYYDAATQTTIASVSEIEETLGLI